MPGFSYTLIAAAGATSKLEALITVPTGNYILTITETGGGDASFAVAVVAGTYYHNSAAGEPKDFRETLEDAINAAGFTSAYTVAHSAAINGTGKYTITSDGAGGVTAFAIVWTTDALRQLLGFTQGNVAGLLTYTGDDHARALWLPDSSYQALNGEGSGWQNSDKRDMESPGKNVFSVEGNEKTVNAIRFPNVNRAKTWIEFESAGLQDSSFERFWRDGIRGRAPWAAAPAGPVRWHPDADINSFFHTYAVMGMPTFKPNTVKENWVGKFAFDLPRLILQD